MDCLLLNDALQAGFHDKLGAGHFFRSEGTALAYVWEQLGSDHAVDCPLNVVCQIDVRPKVS